MCKRERERKRGKQRKTLIERVCLKGSKKECKHRERERYMVCRREREREREREENSVKTLIERVCLKESKKGWREREIECERDIEIERMRM